MLSIPKKIVDAIIAHAQKGYPNEACGLLAGTASRAEVFYPMRNVDESSISYFMDPKEQLKIFKEMRQKKLELTGIYHSHVASEAAPSQKDRRLAFYPEASYLIVSLADKNKPLLKSFKIREETAQEEEIRVT